MILTVINSWTWQATSILALRNLSPLSTNPAAENSPCTDISLKLLRQWGWSDPVLAWIQFRTWHRGCWSYQVIFPFSLVGLDEDSGDVCVRCHRPLAQLTSTQPAAFRAIFQMLPRGNGPQTRQKLGRKDRTAVGQGFMLCFIYHYGPKQSQLKARSYQCTPKQEEMPLCQGQVEPSPCSLPSPSLLLPTAKQVLATHC